MSTSQSSTFSPLRVQRTLHPGLTFSSFNSPSSSPGLSSLILSDDDKHASRINPPSRSEKGNNSAFPSHFHSPELIDLMGFEVPTSNPPPPIPDDDDLRLPSPEVPLDEQLDMSLHGSTIAQSSLNEGDDITNADDNERHGNRDLDGTILGNMSTISESRLPSLSYSMPSSTYTSIHRNPVTSPSHGMANVAAAAAAAQRPMAITFRSSSEYLHNLPKYPTPTFRYRPDNDDPPEAIAMRRNYIRSCIHDRTGEAPTPAIAADMVNWDERNGPPIDTSNAIEAPQAESAHTSTHLTHHAGDGDSHSPPAAESLAESEPDVLASETSTTPLRPSTPRMPEIYSYESFLPFESYERNEEVCGVKCGIWIGSWWECVTGCGGGDEE
ncbi:MAG: hypothetical protein Q9166_005352 [cf. Caloplaca sp. 2 TL-2023]